MILCSINTISVHWLFLVILWVQFTPPNIRIRNGDAALNIWSLVLMGRIQIALRTNCKSKMIPNERQLFHYFGKDYLLYKVDYTIHSRKIPRTCPSVHLPRSSYIEYAWGFWHDVIRVLVLQEAAKWHRWELQDDLVVEQLRGLCRPCRSKETPEVHELWQRRERKGKKK